MQYKRLSEAYPASKGYSLWGDNGVNVHDVNQGGVGNCWMLAAASAMAEHPERLMDIFINEENGS